jgi:hypothetical protein
MSDHQPHVPTQPVQYLAASEGLLGHPTTGEPIIILSLRPNPPSFFVVNIAVTKEQAWRLFADLQNILVPFVLLMSVLTATGCGTRVEVESAKWGSTSGERARTQVEADLLRPQRPELVAELEQKQSAVEAKEKSVIGSGNTIVILNFCGGDTHNETHIHVQKAAPQRIEERVTIRREVQVEPRRPVDERCERLRREHEERVRRWREFPLGH